jgi:molybdenum cofactor cytidylyltransferase
VNKDSPCTISLGVVLLAAGRSTRMGQQKMLLPWKGSSVIGHLIGQWESLGANQVAVVCAADDLLVAKELARLRLPPENRIYNPAPERGMFSSIRCASAWNGWKEHLTHWVIALGDQPHIKRATLRALIDFTARHPTCICQPALNSRPRHPAILPRRHFLELASSAFNTLSEFRAAEEVALCEIEDAGLDLDIDTPDDYVRAMRLVRGQFSR